MKQNSRILCIEDDKDSREMLKFLLESAGKGYAVTGVETAAEAIALINKNEFDLYILDLWLPGMDGVELCRRIRERGISAPILFYSAMAKPVDLNYLMSAGANEYLEKPNDIGVMVDTVDSLLSIVVSPVTADGVQPLTDAQA